MATGSPSDRRPPAWREAVRRVPVNAFAFVSAAALVLWSFGTWWIPLLVVFGVWRHLVRRRPLRYESSVWGMVFPLGMYAVASMRIGDVLDLTLLRQLGAAMTWVALTAWAAAALAMLGTATRRSGSRAEPPPPTTV